MHPLSSNSSTDHLDTTHFGSSQKLSNILTLIMGLLFVASLLFSFHIWSCSGTLVGFSSDATQESPKSWSPTETLSFLQKNKVSSSQFRVFLTSPEAFLDSLSNTQVPIDLFLNPMQSKSLLDSKSSTISWFETHVIKHLPHLNISTIVVNTTEHDLTSLLLTLNSIHSVIENFQLGERIKVSLMFSLTDLEKNLPSVIRIVKQTNSFIFVKAFVDRELSLADGFIHSVIARALATYSLLTPYPEIPLVFNVKSSSDPSGIEIAEFTNKLIKSIDSHPQLKDRISGLFVEISLLDESEQKKLAWEEKLIFPSSHRQLLDRTTVIIHDTVSPITIPSPNPSPDIITVPSTNTTTILPTTSTITVPSTNPTTTPIIFPSPNPTNPPTTTPIIFPSPNPTNPPITVPPTNPVTNPVRAPVTNPTTAPVTIPPAVPVTNPITTPTTNPVNPPVTNPGPTNPFPPPFLVTPATGIPNTAPPAMGTPTGSGQSWCVAKSGTPEDTLQDALDYACGIGGVDCSAIQMSGSCYNLNSLHAHASYAFNSYYQKNPVPTSCDFGGAATLVTINPSTGTCTYPSSSSASGLNPASGMVTGSTGSTGIGAAPTGVTPISGGSGSSVPNPNNSGGSNTVFGSDSPTGTIGSGLLSWPAGGWILLVLACAARLLQ